MVERRLAEEEPGRRRILVELTFALTEDEWANLADKYKEGINDKRLTVRRYFVSKERVKSNQSNIYGIVGGEPEKDLFTVRETSAPRRSAGSSTSRR